MSITTKKGDRGRTSLCFGAPVSKDNIRLEACGTLDELNSFLGLAKSLVKQKKNKKLIESMQGDLFVIGAELATKRASLAKLRKRIDKSYASRLENAIFELEKKKVIKESCFCLPGANPTSGTLDIARTVTRRAERLVVTLKRKGKLWNNFILIYLNRLSDLLYLLARSCEKNRPKLKLR
jgi:cob(I)alamin adenosyltransferase